MAQKIIYFTKSDVPTAAEAQDISDIESIVDKYSVTVSNGSAPFSGGMGPNGPLIVEASFVAGTPPTEYAAIPIFDIEAELNPGGDPLLDTQAIVTSGTSFPAMINAVQTTATPKVVEGVITELGLPNDTAVVSNAKSKPIHNSAGTKMVDAVTVVTSGQLGRLTTPATFAGVTNAANITTNLNGVSRVLTPTVAAGVISGIQTPASVAVVATSDTTPVHNSAGTTVGTGTMTVNNRTIDHVSLSPVVAVVSNDQSLTLDGVEYTFTVAGGVITAIATVGP